MHIREVHINGFGIFHDKSITGLTSGLNVLFGPNEKGKSTLLAFIRRCLFGFPRGSTSTNPYPALAGGAYGGRLICSLDNGNELLVARAAGPSGGRLEARHDDRTITVQQDLSALLGNMSMNLYRNVYAIGLTELEQLKSLDSVEIRDRLYGAELGLGRASITEIRKKIEAHANAQFKLRGTSQAIPQTFREIEYLRSSIRSLQAKLSSYDQYFTTRESRQNRLNNLDQQIADFTKTQRTLETQKQLYSELVSYQTAKEKYDNIPSLGQFHESVIAQLDELKKAVEDAAADVRGKKTVVEDLEMRLKEFNVNEDILAQEASINSLSRISDKYESAANDLPDVRQKREHKDESIRNRIFKMGPSVTFETVREYGITVAQEEQFETLSASLSEATKHIAVIENKIEVYEESSAAKVGLHLEGPSVFRLGVLSLGIIAVIGLVLGIALTNLWLSGVSLLFGIVAGLLLVRLKWGTPLKSVDPLQQKLSSSKAEAEDNLNKFKDSWRTFLATIGLPNDIGSDKAQEVLAEIARLQSEIESLDEYDQRIRDMQLTIENGEGLYSKISRLFGSEQLSGNVIADIPLMSRSLEDEKNQHRVLEELTKNLRNRKSELKTDEVNADAAGNKLTQFIVIYEADDEPDLRSKGDLFEERLQLQSIIDQAQHAIQSSVGMGDDFAAFVSSMTDLSMERISTNLDHVSKEIERLQIERDDINKEIGSLTLQIEQLSSTTELLDLQMQLESKLEKLRRGATDWARSQIALTMLNAAVARYEDTRQPDVIQSAERVFSAITGGAYIRVIKPLQQLELEVLDSTSAVRKISELSRGTVEQLYFAMRMGLIENYEQHAESMPVIMDDVLVNFDDERAILASQAISVFSEGRQLIVMTCHGASRDCLLQVGGNLVEF